MRKQIPVYSVIDGSKAEVTVNGNIQQWKRGKCWHATCSNVLWYVVTSEKGLGLRAYCYECTRAKILQSLMGNYKERGNWNLVKKGKLIQQKINQIVDIPDDYKRYMKWRSEHRRKN